MMFDSEEERLAWKEQRERVEELESWFFVQGHILVVDAEPEGFYAIVMPRGVRVGPAVATGAGSTELGAAEAAREDFLGQGVGAPTLARGESAPIPSGTHDRLDRIAAEFGWMIGFVKEPDGGFRWFRFHQDGGEVQSQGSAPTWDDALLEAISDLQPPSDER